MTTISDLNAMPLRQLRRKAMRMVPIQSVLEVLTKFWKAMRFFARFNRFGRIMLCAELLMALVDDYVDGDLPSTKSPLWHLSHVSEVLESLRTGTAPPLDAEDYDTLIVAIVRLSRQVNRPGLLDLFQEAWLDYTANAQWHLSGRSCDNASVAQAAGERSYALVEIAFLYVLGGDLEDVRALVQRYQAALYSLGRVKSNAILPIRSRWEQTGRAACLEAPNLVPAGWRRYVVRFWMAPRLEYIDAYLASQT